MQGKEKRSVYENSGPGLIIELQAMAGKYKLGARAGKYKYGAMARKYELGARAGGQAQGWGSRNKKTPQKLKPGISNPNLT